MTHVRFLDEAAEEFLEAIRYYAQQSRGIGVDFVDEVRVAIDFIATYPEGATLIRPSVYRKVVRKYPYSLLYTVEPEGILVIAVMRQSRRPGYWHPRLK
jgi:plasmid stabilization system protein ParE